MPDPEHAAILSRGGEGMEGGSGWLAESPTGWSGSYCHASITSTGNNGNTRKLLTYMSLLCSHSVPSHNQTGTNPTRTPATVPTPLSTGTAREQGKLLITYGLALVPSVPSE